MANPQLTVLNQKIKERQERLWPITRQIYDAFKSASAYRKAKESVPVNAVSTNLFSRWCEYTAYCEPIKGKTLLLEQSALQSELEDLQAKRDELLTPFRLTLARKKHERDVEQFIVERATYEREHAEWEAEKAEWERSSPAEIVSVGGIKPEQLEEGRELASYFPGWSCGSPDMKNWEFYIHGKSSKGNHKVMCKRPDQFAIPEPRPPAHN